MTRNNIIDFLYDQSINKDKMLFDILKDENLNLPIRTQEISPKFVEKKKCQNCRFYDSDLYDCKSEVAKKKKCGFPDYKYFEPKED